MGLRIAREVAARLFGEEPAPVDATGRLRLASFGAARELRRRLDPEGGDPELSAGRLNALDRLDALLGRLLGRYLEARPELPRRLLEALGRRLGVGPLQRVLERFTDACPVPGVDLERRPGEAVEQEDFERLLPELLLFWSLTANPASAALGRRLAGEEIIGDEGYRAFAAAVGELLAAEPALDPRSPSLAESLRSPGGAAGSLAEQLSGLLETGEELGEEERLGLLSALDLISEEEMPRFPPGPGPPPEVPSYAGLDDEVQAFTADRDWMPRLVLMAKNCHVWLAQLSRRHGRRIGRLDEIPEAELERLAGWGFTGLWLIGLWEPSGASARIKQLCGQADAAPSAYSLYAYRIAEELGGDEALAALTERAGRHGIRLAADMVPNHMGIDSEWIYEHPERFLSTPTCPFPGYTFDGPDLSSRPEVGIHLEDHYYDRSDAAVVFKRVDRRTGEERYVYHGNDGTSTPWNDTAQLDFLDPGTRAAVLETILGVARTFPVIRFDAAMTLARRHIQRLWYPEPGRGGAIPSRAEHALSRERFTEAMPREFWREVVDRAAEEAPETLLLAEAFWLMEGYFVRTLGMHRVYNSAFMHMLRDGATGSYRRLIRETLQFDPQILGRYVNFLSNPDEETAVGQFGRDDRYLGAALAMSTLPGLPMFAHGQVEGLSEKYGMEFRTPRRDEEPDAELVAAHERRIFPLLRRRGRFAEVDRFVLLDLVDGEGRADEDVLAFATGAGGERSVVLFNNSSRAVTGRLRPAPLDGEPGTDLAAALELAAAPEDLYRFRDLLSRRQFLLAADAVSETEPSADRLRLRLRLEPWESRVLSGFEALGGLARSRLRPLERELAGEGVEDLDEALLRLELAPLARAMGEAIPAPAAGAVSDEASAALEVPAASEPGAGSTARAPSEGGAGSSAPGEERRVDAGAAAAGSARPEEPAERRRPEIGERAVGSRAPTDALARVESELRRAAPETELSEGWARTLAERLAAAERMGERLAGLPWPSTDRLEAARAALRDLLAPGSATLRSLQLLELVASVSAAVADTGPRSWRGVIADALEAAGLDDEAGRRPTLLERARSEGWLEPVPPPDVDLLAGTLRRWLDDRRGRELLGWNRYEGTEWIGREELESVARFRAAGAALAWLGGAAAERREELHLAVVGWVDAMARLTGIAERAGYRAGRVLEILGAARGTGVRRPRRVRPAAGVPADTSGDGPRRL